ncbi:hypothetical protein OS493_023260 [Desmophyllum pertusum]|uniref:G-protein coupled receptors family 1 profile domain-containing protein n=1 Tax=Desmophyllum pertusum TaxID=174260 RepID=A0A9X0CLP7_9CNID|nr:hypothetical protein OS493_023260 [Desmophyllum pertusum]
MANNTSVQVLLPAPSCYHLPDPTFHKVPERYTMNLVTAIVNIVAAPFAVASNLLIFTAIVSRLRTPSNLLIACLALSDVFVGLAVQPGYITYRLMENQLRAVPCFVRVVYANAFYLCCGVAFMTLAVVSYERFIAVRLQARYNDVFSSKRVLKYMVAIWIINIMLTSLQWAGINQISRGAHLIAWLICLLVAGVANIGIILTLHRNRRQVQPAHLQMAEKLRRKRELKLTRSITFIVGVYLLFNLPVLFVTIYHQILEQDLKTYNHYSWTETLAFLNSCTNPLICCWKSRQIRQGVIAILERMSCN